MANTFRIDRYVAEVLLQDLVGHDHSPAAFLVYLYLWSACAAAHYRPVSMSLLTLADNTGLAKRTVQLAVARLKRRRLIEVTQAHGTATPAYLVLKPWRTRR